jgi:hypothetical protein
MLVWDKKKIKMRANCLYDCKKKKLLLDDVHNLLWPPIPTNIAVAPVGHSHPLHIDLATHGSHVTGRLRLEPAILPQHPAEATRPSGRRTAPAHSHAFPLFLQLKPLSQRQIAPHQQHRPNLHRTRRTRPAGQLTAVLPDPSPKTICLADVGATGNATLQKIDGTIIHCTSDYRLNTLDTPNNLYMWRCNKTL